MPLHGFPALALGGALLTLGLAGLPASLPPGIGTPGWLGRLGLPAHEARRQPVARGFALLESAAAEARPVLLARLHAGNVERLAAAPSDGFAWLVEAWLRTKLPGSPPAPVLEALALSYRYAPREQTVMAGRVPLGLLLWQDMEGGLRRHVLDDVREMAQPWRGRDNLTRLVDAARQAGPLMVAVARGEAYRVAGYSGQVFDQLLAAAEARDAAAGQPRAGGG